MKRTISVASLSSTDSSIIILDGDSPKRDTPVSKFQMHSSIIQTRSRSVTNLNSTNSNTDSKRESFSIHTNSPQPSVFIDSETCSCSSDAAYCRSSLNTNKDV